MSLKNLTFPYYHELKSSQRHPIFNEVTWKTELPLLSGDKIFARSKLVCWCDLKIWSAHIITIWNFLKNRAALKIWTVPIIKSWNFCKNILDLMKSFKHLTAPIIMRYNFLKNKVVLMMSLENLTLFLTILSWSKIFAKIGQF